jgi:uncharacterized protein YecE (DUF72 family)
MSDQLLLFGKPAPAPDPRDAALGESRAEAASLQRELPATLFYGTSSWSFPGWRGIVYPSSLKPAAIARDGLREYVRHPLLRTVGIDRSYYAPVSVDDLKHYASQLPAGFQACVKAPAAVTSLELGAAGRRERNPDFLNSERLIDDLLGPLSIGLPDHLGPILLEFPPFPRGQRLSAGAFLTRLDRFLARLPRSFAYAVELRDASLLTADYAALLRRHGVAHVYNYWSAMPMPREQARVVPPDDAPFVVVRLLLRPGTWYEDQRERFQPFNRLVDVDERMRDEVTTLSDAALMSRRKVYVLVNNKTEGSSPLTIMALARALAERIRKRRDGTGRAVSETQ